MTKNLYGTCLFDGVDLSRLKNKNYQSFWFNLPLLCIVDIGDICDDFFLYFFSNIRYTATIKRALILIPTKRPPINESVVVMINATFPLELYE